MLVFWKERLVLLAVPKTGTTALAAALAPRAAVVLRDPPGLKHASLSRYRRHVLPMLKAAGGKDFETVALVREPVSWLSSWYRYRHREDIAGQPQSTREISFDDFARAYAAERSAPFAAVGSQARFVSDGKNGISVTHLFRYEDQERILAFLAARLGPLPDAMPRRNVSPMMDVTLSQETETLLRERCAAEFTVWEMAGSWPALL
jgi:hypothetical protein